MKLPYIGPVSGKFRQQLTHAVQSCYNAVQLRTIFSTKNLISPKTKDRTPSHQLSNVVYEYSCYCDNKYVGRTSQRLEARMKQHVPNNLLRAMKINDQTKLEKTKWSSSIGQHLADNPKCGANFDASQFSVLRRARSDFHLKVLEAIFIQTTSPELCKQKEFVYSTILFNRLI